MEEQNSNSDLLEQETKNFISSDHISALPDSLIHHILSFLPTTKEVIKTSILSNRWRHLWTHVPNLIFYYCKDNQSYGEFIEKAIRLYSSSKIKKFFLQLDSPVYCQMNSRIESWIDFAMAREVEELSLEFCVLEDYYVVPNYSQAYLLPQFFYSSNSLRKLKTQFCDFVPNDKVNWRLLKLLEVGHAKFTDQMMKSILSGCPSLESLKLYSCHGIHRLDIVSKSLKKLVIDGDLDLSIGQVDSSLEIFAPYLENLKLLGYWGRKKCRLINVLSLFYVALDFRLHVDHGDPSDLYEKYRKLVMELLEKVCHVKEQKIGTWFIEILSLMEVQSLPSPLSTRKCLILSMSYFEKLAFPGIARLLQSSPKLERLVVKLCYSASSQNVDYGDDSGENYLTSEKRMFSCLLLHLKRIDIFSFEEHLFGNKHALGLVEFLLMNARVLEQMVISDAYPFHVPHKTDHLLRMAKKLLGVPTSSPHAVVLFPIPK